MTVTEIRLHPENERNKVIRESVQGNDNLLNSMFFAHKKRLDRERINYIFEVYRSDEAPENAKLFFNLNTTALKTAKKLLPEYSDQLNVAS